MKKSVKLILLATTACVALGPSAPALADSDVLAADDVGVQAFSLRRNAGVQFHPEVTAAHVARWIGMGGDIELARLGIDADELLAQTRAMLDDVRARTDALVDWFLDSIATC